MVVTGDQWGFGGRVPQVKPIDLHTTRIHVHHMIYSRSRNHVSWEQGRRVYRYPRNRYSMAACTGAGSRQYVPVPDVAATLANSDKSIHLDIIRGRVSYRVFYLYALRLSSLTERTTELDYIVEEHFNPLYQLYHTSGSGNQEPTLYLIDQQPSSRCSIRSRGLRRRLDTTSACSTANASKWPPPG